MAYRLEPEVQSVSQNKFRKIQAEVFLKLTYHLGPLANHRKCQIMILKSQTKLGKVSYWLKLVTYHDPGKFKLKMMIDHFK